MPLCFVPSAGRLGVHFGRNVLPLASRAVRFVPADIYFVSMKRVIKEGQACCLTPWGVAYAGTR